jgi:hypothetical protein
MQLTLVLARMMFGITDAAIWVCSPSSPTGAKRIRRFDLDAREFTRRGAIFV